MADAPQRYRLWVLRLVPSHRGGRWLCAAAVLLVLLVLVASAGVFTEQFEESASWPAALFFCAILAYIIPVFHYITARTEVALEELAGRLPLDPERLGALRGAISAKTAAWHLVNAIGGVSLWLLQSRLLAGSWERMLSMLTESAVSAVMSLMPLAVWLVMFVVTHALVDNARMFRRLGAKVEIDLLDVRALNPFGRMAVSSTLVVVGAQALFPIMWLGSRTDPWTTIPGILLTSLALAYLFVAPVWPVHRALRAAKQRELDRLRGEINAIRGAGPAAAVDALTPLLIYRREIAGAAEWPFDVSIVARLGLYLIIVPLTWIGAALIENLVDLFISG